MHGLVHVILKSFVVEKLGGERWDEILKLAGVEDEAALLALQQHDDDLTIAAVGAACKVLGVAVDTTLEWFGGHFFDFVYGQGSFSRLLHSLGPTLRDLLSNLNALHHNIERDIPGAIFPNLELRDGVQGEGDPPGTLYLSYVSVRGSVFAPLLRGVLCRLATVMFKQQLTFTELDCTDAHVDDCPTDGEPCTQSRASSVRQQVVWRIEAAQIAGTLGREAESSYHSTAFDSNQSHRSPTSFYDHVVEVAKRRPKPYISVVLIHTALASCCSSAIVEAVIAPLPAASDSHVSPLPETRQLFQDKRHQVLALLGMKPSARMPEVVTSNPDKRASVAQALFRVAPAAMVSAEWTDHDALRKAREFWSMHSKLGALYASHSVDAFEGSRRVQSSNQVWFVSHCWKKPERWSEVMGPSCDYAETKAAEVCIAAKDMAYATWGDSKRWREINLWVDKCCIPQQFDPQLQAYSVHLIEEFIQFSDGLIVQLSWNYFTRLWCVYEWACFLRFHDITDITLCVDPYLREGSFPLLLDAIRNFRLADCDCTKTADRAVLFEKVRRYFASFEAFESLLKFSAISLVARSLVERRHATSSVRALLQPWADLAEELQFHDLHFALLDVVERVPAWRDEVVREARGSSRTIAVQGAFNKRVATWFSAEIRPLVLKQLSGAVKQTNEFFDNLSSEAFLHKLARVSVAGNGQRSPIQRMSALRGARDHIGPDCLSDSTTSFISVKIPSSTAQPASAASTSDGTSEMLLRVSNSVESDGETNSCPLTPSALSTSLDSQTGVKSSVLGMRLSGPRDRIELHTAFNRLPGVLGVKSGMSDDSEDQSPWASRAPSHFPSVEPARPKSATISSTLGLPHLLKRGRRRPDRREASSMLEPSLKHAKGALSIINTIKAQANRWQHGAPGAWGG